MEKLTIQEKIVEWITMLSSLDFKGTFAELVRQDMLSLINIHSQETKLISSTENRATIDSSPDIKDLIDKDYLMCPICKVNKPYCKCSQKARNESQ